MAAINDTVAIEGDSAVSVPVCATMLLYAFVNNTADKYSLGYRLDIMMDMVDLQAIGIDCMFKEK